MELAALLRNLREQKDLTLREVEKSTGLSNSFLSQVERGLRTPSTDALLKLATIYEVPASTLIEARDQGGLYAPVELDYHSLFRQFMQAQLGPAWSPTFDEIPLSLKMVQVKNAIREGSLPVSKKATVKLVIRHSFDRFPANTVEIDESEFHRGMFVSEELALRFARHPLDHPEHSGHTSTGAFAVTIGGKVYFDLSEILDKSIVRRKTAMAKRPRASSKRARNATKRKR